MQDEEEVEEFWQELEEEIGEKILWYSLGELLLPFDTLAKNTVGMFFLTPQFFYFQTFPQNDFLRVLANSFRKKKKGGGRVQKGYPRNALLSAELERPKGLRGRLFGGPMPIVSLNFNGEAVLSGKTLMRFTLLDKKAGEELLEKLGKGTGRGSRT